MKMNILKKAVMACSVAGLVAVGCVSVAQADDSGYGTPQPGNPIVVSGTTVFAKCDAGTLSVMKCETGGEGSDCLSCGGSPNHAPWLYDGADKPVTSYNINLDKSVDGATFMSNLQNLGKGDTIKDLNIVETTTPALMQAPNTFPSSAGVAWNNYTGKGANTHFVYCSESCKTADDLSSCTPGVWKKVTPDTSPNVEYKCSDS